MAFVNIPRDVTDAFYRYKMPVLVAKVEGRGNGIKTVIVNMADIAKSLARPPSYPTKFFGFELGSITTIEQDNDKYIVNGKHDQPKLAQVLDDFIEKFVLCKKCQRNPETYMVIKGGMISLKCKACGGSTPVDMRHKLCTFILKNPPPADKDEKRVKKRAARSTKDDGAEAADDGKEEGEKIKKSSSKSKKKQQQEEDDDDDVVWYTDTSKEAAEQRRKNMLDNTSELAAKLLNTDLNDKPDPLEDLKSFLEEKPQASNSEITAQIKKVKAEHKLDDEATARVAFRGLFNADVFKQIKTSKIEIIKPFLTTVPAQVGAINGLTELGKETASVLKVVPHVLKYLYDQDVIEEKAVQQWYGGKFSGEAKKVKDAAKVFVEWLENAEEEESEEDDEEEEEEDDDDEEEEEEESD